jgi:hypothetical protein
VIIVVILVNCVTNIAGKLYMSSNQGGRVQRRTLAGGRSGGEGVLLSKFTETVLRPRAGDGVVPQLVEKAHIMDEAYFSR